MRWRVFVFMALLLALSVGASAATYTIDQSHSSVGFKVKHMMVSNVRGNFGDFSGSFEFEADKPQSWSVQAEIRTASVFTGDKDRDDHLRKDDFFDVAEHPTMTFEASEVRVVGDDEYVLTGDLTLLGVTRPVELALEYNGMVTDPWGNTRVGWEAVAEVDRKDFGMKFAGALDTGGLVVGNTIKIEIEVEGILQK